MVIWTINAKRQLRHSLAQKLCEQSRVETDLEKCLLPMTEKMQQLDRCLESSFPDAQQIVVMDELTGFRRKDDLHILLVEVNRPEQGGPVVVKVGPKDVLMREIHGWNCCRPVGLRHDLVLLPLEEGIPQQNGRRRGWMTLVYGDAQQFIGVERTVSFEEAFLDAVQFGKPTISSIGTVLVELFERLGHLLYATSFVEDASQAGYVFRMPKVVQGMSRWQQVAFYKSIRSDTNVLVNHGASRFIDPVSYFDQWILPHFRWEELDENKTPVVHRARAKLEESALPLGLDSERENDEVLMPAYQDLIPYMLRGCAHGDLHGRNILVGLVHDRALWPTVFDYEDMGLANLLGWDFVKLETELKIRAFWEILPRTERLFIESVRDFELKLNSLTERHHLDGSWPLVQDRESAQPIERLMAALLELRRMAAQHLGKNRGRAKQWLEEYYFLLAAYGINTENYGNLDRRELVAAYVSSGIAAARLSWPRQREAAERELLRV